MGPRVYIYVSRTPNKKHIKNFVYTYVYVGICTLRHKSNKTDAIFDLFGLK